MVCAPCLAGVLRVCSLVFFTIWVTPEGRLAKLVPSRLFCFNAGFSGSPNGGAVKLSSALFDYVHGLGVKLRPIVNRLRRLATAAQDTILPHRAAWPQPEFPPHVSRSLTVAARMRFIATCEDF